MQRWLGALAGIAAVGWLLWWQWPAGQQPAKLIPSQAIRLPSEEVARCSDCHAAQAKEFLETGHAQALRSADDPAALAPFDRNSVAVGEPPVRFRFWQEGGMLWHRNEKSGAMTKVRWMFGSGHHGMTPVAISRNAKGEDEGPDLHVSWYRGHGLALTMGHELVLGGDPNSLGTFNDASETKRCFQCHTTELPSKGRGVETAHLLPGVLCSKCHPGSRKHAETMHAGETATGFDNWKALSPQQSVERCGECHRSPIALSPAEIHPDNRRITRFASVGLSLSRCFLSQQTRHRGDGTARRLDCLTCHDPHRLQPTDLQKYNDRCLECHSRPKSSEIDCPNRSITSDCVSCHMPKVRMNAPVSFTNHWIRARPIANADPLDESGRVPEPPNK